MPARRMKQEECCELEASLGYGMRPCLKQTTPNTVIGIFIVIERFAVKSVPGKAWTQTMRTQRWLQYNTTSSLTIRSNFSWTLMTSSFFVWEIHFLNLSTVFVMPKVSSIHFQRRSWKMHVKFQVELKDGMVIQQLWKQTLLEWNKPDFLFWSHPNLLKTHTREIHHAETCQHFQIFYLGTISLEAIEK